MIQGNLKNENYYKYQIDNITSTGTQYTKLKEIYLKFMEENFERIMNPIIREFTQTDNTVESKRIVIEGFEDIDWELEIRKRLGIKTLDDLKHSFPKSALKLE